MPTKYDKLSIIKLAREKFDLLSDVHFGGSTKQLDNLLQAIGAGYEILDRAGEKSRDEMAAEIQSRIRMHHIHSARQWFSLIGDGEFPSQYLKNMYDDLAEAGADITALDPTGKTSHDDMDRIIKIKMIKARERENVDTLEDLHDLLKSGFLDSHFVDPEDAQATAKKVEQATDWQRERLFPDDDATSPKPSAPGTTAKKPAAKSQLH